MGTCFSIDVDNKLYFVTAKHIIENLVNEDQVELFHNNERRKFDAIITGHSWVADVSVFMINAHIPRHPLPCSIAEMIYWQDLYFLGFPLGLKFEVGAMNANFPVPLAKKGILSAMLFDQPGKPFLIDGHNNRGFSGGPVVFKPANKNDFYVAGVIHGYLPEEETFLAEDGSTTTKIKTNTGIMIAYAINNALDLIRDNPNWTNIPTI